MKTWVAPWEEVLLRGVRPIGKHCNSELCNNGWMLTFAQYTDGKLFSLAKYRRDLLEGQHYIYEKSAIKNNEFSCSCSTLLHSHCTLMLNTSAWHFNQWQCIPKNSTNRLMLKPFLWLQTTERFVHGGDAAFCQITLTTCWSYLALHVLKQSHSIFLKHWADLLQFSVSFLHILLIVLYKFSSYRFLFCQVLLSCIS